MTCVACNSLKARNKTCWRHPVPGVPVIEVDHATVPTIAGKINHDANLNSLFPQHATHQKKPLAIVTLSWRFALLDAAQNPMVVHDYEIAGGTYSVVP